MKLEELQPDLLYVKHPKKGWILFTGELKRKQHQSKLFATLNDGEIRQFKFGDPLDLNRLPIRLKCKKKTMAKKKKGKKKGC